MDDGDLQERRLAKLFGMTGSENKLELMAGRKNHEVQILSANKAARLYLYILYIFYYCYNLLYIQYRRHHHHYPYHCHSGLPKLIFN